MGLGNDKMNTLITGGFGYLGGRFAQHLQSSRERYRVRLGSRRERTAPPWCADATTVITTWELESSLEEACSGVDVVVHLSGMNASECAADPVQALEINGVATARLLRAAIRTGVKRFVFVSTAHVYGSPLRGRISEETNPNSLHPYASSHRAGGDVVRDAHARGQIQGVDVRLSNSFGAPTHADTNCWMLVVNDLCRQAALSRTMVLNTSSDQRRDFITLTDACRAIAHLASIDREQLGDGLFNVGGEWAPTLKEIAERIGKSYESTFGHPVSLSCKAPQSDSTAKFELDYRIDKLTRTGFTLEKNIDSEIADTLAFCAKRGVM